MREYNEWASERLPEALVNALVAEDEAESGRASGRQEEGTGIGPRARELARAKGRRVRLPRRGIAFRRLWILCIVALVILSAVSVLAFRGGASHVLAVVWALYFGASGLLFGSRKVLATFFGGTLGVSASEVGTANGLISSLVGAVDKLATQAQSSGLPESIVRNARVDIWIFVLIFGAMCLPALFGDE
jgi:hypothetical protein